MGLITSLFSSSPPVPPPSPPDPYIYFRKSLSTFHRKFDEGSKLLIVEDRTIQRHHLSRIDEISQVTGKKKIVDVRGREAIDLLEETPFGGIAGEEFQ
jgi:hypothetical protein